MDDAEGTLNDVLARLSERARRPIQLDDLVRRWDTFVGEVERGYAASIYDYTDDLSVRDLLAEILSAIPIASARALEDAVQKADATYRSATSICPRPLLPLPPGLHSWWWFRIPVHLSGELRDDFIAAGLLRQE